MTKKKQALRHSLDLLQSQKAAPVMVTSLMVL
jgi:hypothetical protein